MESIFTYILTINKAIITKLHRNISTILFAFTLPLRGTVTSLSIVTYLTNYVFVFYTRVDLAITSLYRPL